MTMMIASIRPSLKKEYTSSEPSSTELSDNLIQAKICSIPKSLKFDSIVIVREVEHIYDISKEEIENRWYQRKDFRCFRSSSMELVKMMSLGKYNGDSEFQCIRGLEGKTRIGAKIRQSVVLRSIISVLEEQERQRLEGYRSVEDIADSYREECRQSLCQAQERGKLDESEAIRIALGEEVSSIENIDVIEVTIKLEGFKKEKTRETLRSLLTARIFSNKSA
jgi:hypothetical protein